MLNYALFSVAIGSIYALLALGLNLIWGGTGMVNLGLAGFFAVGAYVSALVTTTGHLPIAAGWVLALIAGGIAAWSSRPPASSPRTGRFVAGSRCSIPR